MTWEFTASDRLNWAYGKPGKGFVLRNGNVHTWTHSPYADLGHQEVYARSGERSPLDFCFFLDPDGGIHDGGIGYSNSSHKPDDNYLGLIMAADERLYDTGKHSPQFEDHWDLNNLPAQEDPPGPDYNYVLSAYETDPSGKRVWNMDNHDWSEYTPNQNGMPGFNELEQAVHALLNQQPGTSPDDSLFNMVMDILRQSGRPPGQITKPEIYAAIHNAINFVAHNPEGHEGSPDIYKPGITDAPRFDEDAEQAFDQPPQGLTQQIPGWGTFPSGPFDPHFPARMRWSSNSPKDHSNVEEPGGALNELVQWLADAEQLGSQAPSQPSIHHDSEDDIAYSPAASSHEGLPFIPPSEVKQFTAATESGLDCPACGTPMLHEEGSWHTDSIFTCPNPKCQNQISRDWFAGHPHADEAIWRGMMGQPKQAAGGRWDVAGPEGPLITWKRMYVEGQISLEEYEAKVEQFLHSPQADRIDWRKVQGAKERPSGKPVTFAPDLEQEYVGATCPQCGDDDTIYNATDVYGRSSRVGLWCHNCQDTTAFAPTVTGNPEIDTPIFVADHATNPRFASDDGSADELHVALSIPERITKRIHNWVKEQDWPKGTELEDPEDYHITLLYVSEGYDEHKDAEWIRHSEGYKVKIAGLDDSFGKDDDHKATVLRIESDEVHQHANDLIDAAENHGLPIKRFPGGYRCHLTLAYGPGKPKYARAPKFGFTTGPTSVSTPRLEKTSNAQPYYHVAPAAARNQIRFFGLKPQGTFQNVFMWRDPQTAQAYHQQMQSNGQPYDMWQVHPNGVQVQRDKGPMIEAAPVTNQHLTLMQEAQQRAAAFPIYKFHSPCPTCGGKKIDPGPPVTLCPTCKGSGKFPRLDAPGDGGEWEDMPGADRLLDKAYTEQGDGYHWLNPQSLPGLGTPHQGKTAAMTLPQEQRHWADLTQALSQEHQPQFEPVHSFPDGWTINRVTNTNDVNRVGQFMHNCWQGRDLENENPRRHYYTMHDEHGLPRVAFHELVADPHWGEVDHIAQPLGPRNAKLDPSHFQRFKDWEQARGKPMYVMAQGYTQPLDSAAVKNAYFSGGQFTYDEALPEQLRAQIGE